MGFTESADAQIEQIVGRMMAVYIDRVLAQMQMQDKTLYRALKQLQQTVAEMQTDLSDSLGVIKAGLDGEKADFSTTQKQLELVQQTLAGFSEQLVEMDGRLDEPARSSAEMMADIQRRLDEPKTDPSAHAAIASTNARLDQLIGAVRTLDGRITDLRTRLDGYHARLAQTDAHTGETDAQLAALEGSLRTISGKLGQLDSEIQSLASRPATSASGAAASSDTREISAATGKRRHTTRVSGEWAVPLLASRRAAAPSSAPSTSSDGDDSPLNAPFRYAFGTAAMALHAANQAHQCAVALPPCELGSSDADDPVRCAGIVIAEGVPSTRFPFLGAQLICSAISTAYAKIGHYVDNVEEAGDMQPVVDLTRFTHDLLDDFKARAEKITNGIAARRERPDELVNFLHTTIHMMADESVFAPTGAKLADLDAAAMRGWLEPAAERLRAGKNLLFSTSCIFVLVVRNRVLVWTLGNGQVHLGEKIVTPDETHSTATVYRLLYSHRTAEPVSYFMAESPYLVDGRMIVGDEGILPSVRVSADSDAFDIWITSETGRTASPAALTQEAILSGLNLDHAPALRLQEMQKAIRATFAAAPADTHRDISVGLLRGTREFM